MSLWGAPVSDSERTTETSFPQVERRAGLTEEKVLLLIANAVTTQASQTEERLTKHIDAKMEVFMKHLDERVSAIQDVFTDHVAEAFPDGPLTEHKEDHEAKRRWRKLKERLGEDLLLWVVKGLLTAIGLIGVLGFFEWIKAGIK
jgi:hypothetical protein